MTKTRVIVPLLLAVLLASGACLPAAGQVPAAYPTTGSPAFSIPNASYPPATSQQPSGSPYVAWSQGSYGSYQPAGERQVALYSASSAPTTVAAADCGCQPNPYASPADCGYTGASCMPCSAPQAIWIASAGGLLMSIDESHHYFFSYDTGDESDQYTDWRNVNIEWGGGFEVALRRFGACSCTGWEAIYWGLFPGAEYTSTYGANMIGDLNGILNWDQLDYNGDTADTWVNDALVHRLRRDVEIHNVEANHVVLFNDECCLPWRAEVLCGMRFFRFSDELQFAADTVDTAFSHSPEELYYDMDMDNTLVGCQVGGWGEYNVSCRLSVAAGAKVGVYNNHINAYSRIGGAAGTAVINNGPNDGRAWRVDVSKNDVALLGELQLAMLYQITPNWRANLGYRVVGVTGVASPTDQIYPDLRGLQDVELVDSHGSLFMHGFSANVERQW